MKIKNIFFITLFLLLNSIPKITPMEEIKKIIENINENIKKIEKNIKLKNETISDLKQKIENEVRYGNSLAKDNELLRNTLVESEGKIWQLQEELKKFTKTKTKK